MTAARLPSYTGALAEENRQALNQLAALLEHISPASYQHLQTPQATQSVGKHVRHILEHYQTLLDHLNASACLDYEGRKRDTRLETCPQTALQHLHAIDNALTRVATLPADTALTLGYPLDANETHTTAALPSSLGRELAFLTSHSIHHMALISLLCAEQDITLPKHFGVHPSTLRHWKALQTD